MLLSTMIYVLELSLFETKTMFYVKRQVAGRLTLKNITDATDALALLLIVYFILSPFREESDFVVFFHQYYPEKNGSLAS